MHVFEEIDVYSIRHENKGVAGAGRPPSLLVVATSSAKSLELFLYISCNYAYVANHLHIRTSTILVNFRPVLDAATTLNVMCYLPI